MKFLFCVIFVVWFYSAAFACTCVVNLPEEEQIKAMEEVDTIFYGEVISIGEKRRANREGITVKETGQIFYRTEIVKPIKFKVLRFWKGEKAEEITVEANAHDSCQLNIEIGEKHLIYAGYKKVPNSVNYVNYCSPSRFEESILKKVYGDGEIVEEEKIESHEQTKIPDNFFSIIWLKLISFFS